MIKRCVIFLGSMLLCLSAFSQNYDQSVGIRLGLTNGIAYKASFDGVSGLELIGSYRHSQRYVNLIALYEIHFYTFDIDNLYLVAGVGGHVGSAGMGTPYLVLGADALVGIEYALDQTPLAFTLDVKPAISLVGRRNLLDIGWFGVSARLTFE